MSTMLEELWNSNTIYLSIVGWKLAQKVNEDTPWATKREYETSDWAKKVKFEKYYKWVTWLIKGLEFRSTDFGEQFVITLYKEWQEVKISMPTDSNYFTDFAKKLPKINLDKEIRISSFEFESDKGKKVKWFFISQDGVKVENDYYFDKDKKKTRNWMPEVDKKESKNYDKDDWKMFFLKVKKFLKSEVEKKAKDIKPISHIEELPWDEKFDDEVSVEDLPFN